MTLSGRVAVITGGGSGIGRATAVAFAAAGARVAVVDRDRAAAEAVAAEIPGAMARVADVGAPGSADADVAAILAAWARIDVLVTAAGFSCGGTVTTTAPDDWDAVFRTNVGGTWLWARAVIPAMQRQGGGAIITVASQLALAGGHHNSAYVASKGAILALTRTMALDYAADGIRVNALAPGWVITERQQTLWVTEEGLAAHIAKQCIKEQMTPDDIVGPCLFLASDAARMLTAQTMIVDGGYL